jgi:L,D-transpeptidase catalytic domain
LTNATGYPPVDAGNRRKLSGPPAKWFDMKSSLVLGLLLFLTLPASIAVAAGPGDTPAGCGQVAAFVCHAATKTAPSAISGTVAESSPAVSMPLSQSLPLDPCLPTEFGNWQEASLNAGQIFPLKRFKNIRIVIDREVFSLKLEGIANDGAAEVLYETRVALGVPDAPTPLGRFVINHVYCYPDVLFFTDAHEAVPDLYDGFLAPLQRCDSRGNCSRYRELGIHGFKASAYPNPDEIITDPFGPVSGGCIRVPDPCRFKSALIRLVGIGPPKKNERGWYHWLERPVEVTIVEGGEEVTILSLLQGVLGGFLSPLMP